MTTNNILTQLNLPKYSVVKDKVTQLIKIHAMLTGLKSHIIDFDTENLPGYNFGQITSVNSWGEKYATSGGEKMDCERFIIKTTTGTYKQVVPVNCDLYPAFLDLIGLSKMEVKPLFKVEFNKLQTLTIKKALKFVSKDEFRPAIRCFEVKIKPGKFILAATDGFKILKSSFDINLDFEGEKTYLIPAETFKGHKGLLTISFFDDCYIINRQKFNYLEDAERYPDYNSLWPAYNKGVTFYKNDLIQALKSIKPILNRYNPLVKFSFNGDLKIAAENLDYNNETDIRLNLIQNDLQPFTIGFNCNYFLDCLDIIQSNKITIETNGQPDKMVLINDEIVLMPVKIESYE